MYITNRGLFRHLCLFEGYLFNWYLFKGYFFNIYLLKDYMFVYASLGVIWDQLVILWPLQEYQVFKCFPCFFLVFSYFGELRSLS